jgi:DNA repair exonuclease SbcCD ATPase subunit
MNLNNLKEQIKSLEQNTAELKGQVSTLESQFKHSTLKLKELKETREINKKAIELLTFVSQSTREKIQELFERVVTQALQYVYQSNDYNFQLDFDRRGSLPKLTFLLKTPEMQEKHDILQITAGGERDVIALALRFVLLEISKNQGFLFLDEPFKRLRTEETILQAINFIKEMQQKTNRQMFLIAKDKLVAECVSNPIILYKRKKVYNKPKKRRGRPKGSKNPKETK